MRLNLAMVVAALLFAPASAHPTASDESVASLEGVWVSRNAFGPELGGDLVITRQDGNWRGQFAGAEAVGDTLELKFANDRGVFRGAEVEAARTIDGWWVQPRGLAGQAYATPVRLTLTRPNEWRGVVRPLAQNFTLYLGVTRNEDGRWVGALRNPQFNMNGGASRFFLERTGDEISFTTPDGRIARKASVLEGGARLAMVSPPLQEPLSLVRVKDLSSEAWFPSTRGPYAYAHPDATNDGWRTARARAVGVDEAKLANLVQSVIDSDPSSRRPQLIHSLLIARKGRLILEEYFHGYDRDTPHDIRSAGKTISSVLLGAVMQKGGRIGPQTRIYDLLQAQGPFAHPDPRKQSMTLAHLMTHTSGLDCNDNDENSPGNEGAMQSQDAQSHWWRFALDLPLAHEPGARYAYCTAGMNLIGAALRRETGDGVPELFDRLIAQPLQFGLYHWNLAPDGEGYLGGGAYLRPRDLLKLGQVYLNDGVWRGRRIVSRDWVKQSTAPHVDINETTTGMSAEMFANVATRGADGYAWHRYGVRVGDRRVEAFEANGNGGQFLFVVPEYELVVVLTGGNYGQGGIWTKWRDDIVGARIITAIRD